ncbi:MAG: amino acid permease [Legionellales bacterium]|nr:amino acid permease [Legionellales bacterium]
MSIERKRVLSVFSLVMINIIAVDSIRNLPFSAEYGFSILFYYLVAAIAFFIPIALVAAELATGWPKNGGMYIWVREAFGKKWGFVAIWLQWIYNVVWYPSILAFLVSTATYLINPHLDENRFFMVSIVMLTFWGATLLNCFGMQLSGWISTIGAIIGTLLPMAFMIVLGIIWLCQGHPSQIQFNWHSALPNLSSINNLAFLIAVLFGLLGMEMSAAHAEEVKNPQRDYPRALRWSTLLILGSLMLSSLAIAVVIPTAQISLVSGVIDAFGLFFNVFHLPFMIPIMAICIIIGGISGVSAWIIGPTKGLLEAARDDNLPAWLQKTNHHGAPVPILLLQGVLFSILCSAFLLFPTVNGSYWFFSALTAQLAMMVYLFMFAAAIRLRYTEPNKSRAYKIPLGNFGMWVTAGIGFLTCLAAIAIGFIPPTGIILGNLFRYESLLIIGIFFSLLIPLILHRISDRRKR